MTDPVLALIAMRLAAIGLAGVIAFTMPADTHGCDASRSAAAFATADVALVAVAPALEDAELRDMRLHD